MQVSKKEQIVASARAMLLEREIWSLARKTLNRTEIGQYPLSFIIPWEGFLFFKSDECGEFATNSLLGRDQPNG